MRNRFTLFCALACALILFTAPNRPAGAQGATSLIWARGQGPVNSFSASADGSLLAEYSAAAFSGYRVVRIIRTSDFHSLHTYPIPTGTGTDFTAFAMSPDGRYFAVENADTQSFSLYRVSDGSVVWTVQDNMGGPGRWGFTPDSSKLIYSSSDQDAARKNYRVSIRNVSDGSVVNSVYGWLGWQGGVSQGSDEMVLSYLASNGWRVDFYRASTGSFVQTWNGQRTVMGYSADGQYVLAQNDNEGPSPPLHAYRRSDGAIVSSMPIYPYGIVALAVSGSHVCIGGGNATGNVLWDYDIPTGAGGRVDQYPPDGLIRDVARLTDGTCLIGIAADTQGPHVDAYKDGQHLFHDHGMTTESMGLRVSPDGTRIVTADKYSLYLWNAETGDLLSRVDLYAQGLQYAAPQEGLLWAPDGALLFMQTYNPITRDYRYELRSAADLSLVRAWVPAIAQLAPRGYSYAAFTPNSRQVITTYTDVQGNGKATWWDVATGAGVSDYAGYGGSIAISPVSGYVAIQGGGFLGIDTADLSTTIASAPDPSLGGNPNISFSRDGSTIVLGFRSDWYSYVFGFDGTALTQLARFPFTNALNIWEPLAIDPTNSYVLRSYSLDNFSPALLTLTPIGAGSERFFDQEIGFGRLNATNVAFTPDGRRIVYTLADGTVAVAQNPLSDQFPPSTTATVSPTPTAAGWNNTDVTVTLHATDNIGGSGVKQIVYRLDGGAQTVVPGDTASVTVTGEVIHTVFFNAEDNSGNAEPEKTQTVRIDTTPPTISGAADRQPNADLWYNAPVTVTFTASDPLYSGIASVSSPVTLSAEGANQSAAGTATDNAGNSASATVGGINIDTTAPAVSIVSPQDGGVYSTGQTLTADWSVSDGLSGVASVAGTTASGSPIDTSSSGQKTFVVTATDRAGNTSTVTVTYTVNPPPVPVPVSVTFSPPTVTGGSNSTGTVTMSAPVIAATVVNLSSSSAAAAVPVSVTIPANATSATFTAKSQAVVTDTTVVVTASASGGQASGSLTVAGPVVASIKLRQNSVQNGGAFSGNTVTLSGPAPAGGLNVTLTGSGPAFPQPSNLLVPAGSSSGSFSVHTAIVAADTVATITASLNGSSKSASLTVTASTLVDLSFTSTSVKPGQQTSLRIILSTVSGGQAVSLASSDPGIVAVPASVVVPAGQLEVYVTLTAGSVTKKTNVTVTGTLFGVSKKATVTVSP